MAFSLYVHIPWCRAKCPYCDFNSHAAAAWPEDEYVAALIAEMRARSANPAFSGQPIATIFFGGGTPSLFAPRSIAAILDAAADRFGLVADAEITLEANPGTVDLPKLFGYRTAGVNRISFGAQSFSPGILRFLGRIHGPDETRDAIRAARRAGFARLNLDLIFAVPGQSRADVMADLDAACALEPEHISAYNLTFEEGTAFFTEMRRGRIRPLPSDDQAAMYASVREELPRRGYAMYEISNYARVNEESRHNLTYWRAESYLGIGAGAHSFARDSASPGGRRWWNERMPARYIAAVQKTGLAESGGETIDARVAAGEFVFLNLRLRKGFARCEFHERFGQPLDDLFGQQIERLTGDGLLEEHHGRIRLTERGLEMADSVFAEFI
jgi:oxygen-independent coproporphyrinogen-3 oxidase